MDPTRMPPLDWSTDPLELDRTLDGELDPAALAARRADAARDPTIAARLAARGRFLGALAGAGAAYRRGLGLRVPVGLEARVVAALSGRPARGVRPLRWMAAAAALLVLGLVVSTVVLDAGRGAEAMPPEVIKAVEAARSEVSGLRTCSEADSTNPRDFPPVREGTLQVLRCVQDGEGTIAKLYRPESLPSVGYVAVPEEGAGGGPAIGLTDLGDMVVFDLLNAGKRYYLAVSSAFLAEERVRTPGRETCVACHNRSREGLANPHAIIQRSWRLR